MLCHETIRDNYRLIAYIVQTIYTFILYFYPEINLQKYVSLRMKPINENISGG